MAQIVANTVSKFNDISALKNLSFIFGDPGTSLFEHVGCLRCSVKFDKWRQSVESDIAESTTGSFPPSDIQSNGDIVLLQETADTLEILFQFTYPQRQPLLNENMNSFAAVAEAAEKYEVFSAISVCGTCDQGSLLSSHHIETRKNVNKNPSTVLSYAARHGYKDLADRAGATHPRWQTTARCGSVHPTEPCGTMGN
ncbi:hypothetical protein H0H81_004221 [Sphagnurus paluster]|uniref:Uncharacterized protein n=1 Tax=Sphagnurus paluster TaxID=117069 RepID=A0A9P7FYG0_9AGAR|nr:hypothetical protein H0H81_004221 [Sphagnurus paluster]